MILKGARFEIRIKDANDPYLIGGLAGSSRTREAAERRVTTWSRNPRKYGNVKYEVVEVTSSGEKHESGENPASCEPTREQKHLLEAGYGFGEKSGMSKKDWMRNHEAGCNPTVSQQKANRQKPPRRRDYGQGIHVEYSPGNAAYFVMWHHEVLSIHPTWEGADEKARGLVLNKTRDGSDECSVVSSHAAVTLKRTQSGEPPVVEHYRRLSEAIARARRYMKENPPGEHGRITIESHERGRYLSRVFKTTPKNAFEWQWSEK